MPLRPPQIIAALSHAAVFAGLYVGAAVVCFVQLSGISHVTGAITIEAALFATLTATAVYLLDRVKLRDAWLDPADAVAQPGRQRFLAGTSARARLTRAAAATIACAAAIIGTHVTPLAPEFVLLAIAGVVVYAGRPRRRADRLRVKDRLIIKNLFVALGIAGFAGSLTAPPNAAADALRLLTSGAWMFAAAQVAARVFADASLCDLDDEHADRLHDTATLATELGRHRAWSVAMAMRLAAAAALILVPMGPHAARWAWSCVTVASTLGLRKWSPHRLRDAVELRFVLEAVAATALIESGWL